MCSFFSLVSNGKGKVHFFLPEDVAAIMAKGNPESYDFNSHTSLMHFKKILGSKEDSWNKWEYNPETKEIKEDTLAGLDDRKEAKEHLDAFFVGKDIVFLRNLYGRNSGDLNSGDLNSGDLNSGNLNSGNRNSGYLNSGNRNSGYLNSNDPTVRMFNQDTGKTFSEMEALIPGFLWSVSPTEWVEFSAMTDAEKVGHPKAYVCDGYLKVIGYKASWAKVWASASDADRARVLALPNFDAAVFEEISGIKV